MICLTSIAKTYQTDDVQTLALQDINLTVAQGEFIAVMGPSGCGKSTLLNILGLLDSPSAGSYQLLGNEVADKREKQLSKLRNRHIGFIFQSYNLIEELTVEENIELALLYRKVPLRERRTRVAEIMDRVGVGHRASHKPGQLSGGQQQRVAVARALVGKPGLILADEPTGNLDSRQSREIMEMLRSLNEEGATIVMVTHSARDADYARRTVNLFDGQVVTERLRAVS